MVVFDLKECWVSVTKKKKRKTRKKVSLNRQKYYIESQAKDVR